MKTKKKQQSKKESSTLHDLFIHKLDSLYYVENKLLKALPKMAKAASDPDLREAFTTHLKETENHVRRLEDALTSLGEKAKKESTSAIDGLIEDSEAMLKKVSENEARDAMLIAAAESVENYEMAGYETAIKWARLMGHMEAEELLSETLTEEATAYNKLETLAEGGIDEAANMEESPIAVL
jgi:ferritin-like metal-binding protein YciE